MWGPLLWRGSLLPLDGEAVAKLLGPLHAPAGASSLATKASLLQLIFICLFPIGSDRHEYFNCQSSYGSSPTGFYAPVGELPYELWQFPNRCVKAGWPIPAG